jgi:hypothetical protein
MAERIPTLEELDRAFAQKRQQRRRGGGSHRWIWRRGFGRRAVGAVLFLIAAAIYTAGALWSGAPMNGTPSVTYAQRGDVAYAPGMDTVAPAGSLTLSTNGEAALALTVVFRTAGGGADAASYPYSVDGVPAGSVRSGESIPLRHGQTAVIRDIPAGTAYTVHGLPPTGYAVTGADHAGSVGEQGAAAAFTAVRAAQSLRVSASAVNADGSGLSEEQQEETFSFTAAFAGENAPEDVSFRLKPGEERLFADIPAGVAWSVIRTDTGRGDTPLVTEYTGVAAGGEAALPFMSVYGETDAQTPVSLTVARAESSAPGDEWYAYRVSFEGENAPETQTFLLQDGMEAVLEHLPAGVGYTVSALPREGGAAAPGVITVKGIVSQAGRALFTGYIPAPPL